MAHTAGRWAGLALACLFISGSAWANNTQTVNTSESYVDLSTAAAFASVPSPCTEAIGGSGAGDCGALGSAAVEAINGSGLSPDEYWSYSTQAPLTAVNTFVPNNTGWEFAGSGYAPTFSQHKYDLFGQGKDSMGPLSREELLFLSLSTGDGFDLPQTEPGNSAKWDAALALLTMPQTDTTINMAGVVFNIADLKFYTEMTGLSTGGRTTVNQWCVSYMDSQAGPGAGNIICPMLSVSFKATLYLDAVAWGERPNKCAGTSAPGRLALNNCADKDQYINQVVTGYVEAWASLGGSKNFTQNFRSQFAYDPTHPLGVTTPTLADFRMEQALDLGQTAFEASRQTFQSAMATVSSGGNGSVIGSHWGQLVSQDVLGYFYSCINCDSMVNAVSHAFTPVDLGLTFMPYQSTWRDLPSIGHGASGGNLTAFASGPGDVGP